MINICEVCGEPTKTQRLDRLPKKCGKHIRTGAILSKKSRKLMSTARKAYYEEHPEAKVALSETISRIQKGRLGTPHTEQTKKKLSEMNKKHAALVLPNCKCWVHSSNGFSISSLTWKLTDFLVEAGFEDVIAEQKVGRFIVDALLPNEWIAFEGDGKHWHKEEYDKIRDEELLRDYNLPVVRLTEEEVNGLSST